MWAIFGILFAALAVAGALLLGWGIPLVGILAVVLAGAAVVFFTQRTAVEPTTDAETGDGGGRPTWLTRHWWQ